MQALITRLKTGDPLAFNEIFNRYWKMLYLSALKRVGDEQIAQDLVQEIFIRLWDKRESLNLNSETIENYLLKSVKNKVINHFIYNKTKDIPLENVIGGIDDISPSLFNQRKYEELELLVKDEIEKLPGNMKAIFKMREEKASIKQISISLNLAEQTVKNNITGALSILKKSIKDKFSLTTE